MLLDRKDLKVFLFEAFEVFAVPKFLFICRLAPPGKHNAVSQRAGRELITCVAGLLL